MNDAVTRTGLTDGSMDTEGSSDAQDTEASTTQDTQDTEASTTQDTQDTEASTTQDTASTTQDTQDIDMMDTTTACTPGTTQDATAEMDTTSTAATDASPTTGTPALTLQVGAVSPPRAGPVRMPRSVQARRQGIMSNPVLNASEKRTIEFLRRETNIQVKSLFQVLNETAKSKAALQVELKQREADIEFLEEEMRGQYGES